MRSLSVLAAVAVLSLSAVAFAADSAPAAQEKQAFARAHADSAGVQHVAPAAHDPSVVTFEPVYAPSNAEGVAAPRLHKPGPARLVKQSRQRHRLPSSTPGNSKVTDADPGRNAS